MRCTSPIPHDLQNEIDAFRDLKEELVSDHEGEYVLIKHGKPHGFFRSFTEAQVEARERFGESTYLIRQIQIV